jgi:asparagine synthase (glutamine-hydrolysing)
MALIRRSLVGGQASLRGCLALLRGLLDEHCSGRRNHHTRLWALLMLELWFRMWIDGAADAADFSPSAFRPAA